MNKAEIEAKRDELGNLLQEATLWCQVAHHDYQPYPEEERQDILQRLATLRAFLSKIAGQVKQAGRSKR